MNKLLHSLTAKDILLLLGFFLLGAMIMLFFLVQNPVEPQRKHWKFQSIDTMKTSRDKAREELHDPDLAKNVDKQVSDIAATGATHIAIGTPYDDEFLPVIKLWSRTARQHGLKVWFRGNWSGWEKWFGYDQITEQEHITKTDQFIRNNPTLFEDGDVFSSCPECENGDGVELNNSFAVIEYRKFLIQEYETSKRAFASIDKQVESNYFSMNAHVAKKVMDPETTKALDGIVVIDHYVKTPQELAQDVVFIANLTGGKVVLGEMGVPIPDINGKMTEEEQKKWLNDAMMLLASLDELEGVSYWVNIGGSTALWNADNSPKSAVDVLTRYYGGKTK